MNEGGLVGVGNVVSKKGRLPFCQNPEDHINHGDWTKLADLGGAWHLRDERDDPIVEATEVDGSNIELVEDGHDLRFNHVPEGLEEFNREAIRSRCRGGIHAFNGILDLLLGEGGRKGRVLRLRHQLGTSPTIGGKREAAPRSSRE